MAKIYLVDLVSRNGALWAETRHDLDGWLVRLHFKGGTFRDIKLARNAALIQGEA